MKKLFVTTLLAITLLGGGSVPQPALALVGGPVTEIGPNLVTNTINTVETVAASVKEYVLDGLAWQLANVALEQMTQDIVTWINSGFNGSPAFLQDPGRFLSNIADNVAGDFLEEIGGGFLCSPFSADIQFALEIGYYQSGGNTRLADRYSCTLSDALGNVEEFLDNDLSQGGLEQFFNVAVRPENSPYLLTVDLQRELDGRIFGELEEEKQILEWNGGFLSKRECREGEEEPNCKGDILTPGDTIQNQLNESLGIGRDRLLVANDINEIIGALMNQLVSQALGGARGLLGTSSSGGGSSSYFDQTNNPGVAADDREELEEILQDGIASGNRANRTLDGVISDAQEVSAIYSTALAQGNCTSANLSQLNDMSIEASLYRADAFDMQDVVDQGIRSLGRLLGDLLASNSRSEYLVIAQEYQRLLQAGQAPNEATVAEASLLEARVSALTSEAQNILNNCGS
tara:strand:+ start:6311 stop:7690 length:1380 start_codon:yes stop_codon:yes gene_type:complete